MESVDETLLKISKELKEKIESHQIEVIESQQFQENIKYLSDITFDFINAIRAISIYSTRAKDIYNKQLTIKASDRSGSGNSDRSISESLAQNRPIKYGQRKEQGNEKDKTESLGKF